MTRNAGALQPQRLVQEIVFGPYRSRRFGMSLGVNPLPRGSRLCNYDCIYCECGTASGSPHGEIQPQFATPDEVASTLKQAATRFGPDDLEAITLCGNGEPTLCRNLDRIVDVVIQSRDYYWPQARTVILTNGTTCHRSFVRNALARMDERIVKLDAGTNCLLEQINRPSEKLTLTELVRRISMLPDIVIQSMFVEGPLDNTQSAHVEVWTEWLLQLKPASVQIYSLDREPAMSWARAVPREKLESIAHYVEARTGILARVYS